MSKIYKTYKILSSYTKKIIGFLVFLSFLAILFYSLFSTTTKSYSIFVEFNNAYGIKEGTPVNYRGTKVGVVTRLSVNLHKVVILLRLNSDNTFIPSNCIFEANQIGIFNDIVIEIIPTASVLDGKDINKTTNFLIHNSYVKGYKGLSYDDLIRSTTRISQRFDDPRFFSLFNLFLKNMIYFSDEALILTDKFNNMFYLFTELINLSLLNNSPKN
uniref:Mce/MlaD domain-containing protein n=1 Tax=Polysiphonia sertularioides TaxID=945028 RepID=A0A1Z1MFV2_9FLOR|nr:hypothetical protein [Polysiphonia sertularioides]